MVLQMLLSLLVPFVLSTAVPDWQINDIVGGTAVSPQFKYPWLVSLNKGYHFCGGNLLDATTIVTAAHCSVRQTASSVTVYAHRHNLGVSVASENGLTFKVTRITVHPKYTTSNQANDVAVWKIALTSGNVTDVPTGIVSLDDGSASVDGGTLDIAGWGTTSAGGSASKILLETSVNLISQAACKKQYASLDASSICAAAPGKDTCQGDSGGPLFAQNNGKITLVGLTSYGQGCADPSYAGVYTRVSTVADWIRSEQAKP